MEDKSTTTTAATTFILAATTPTAGKNGQTHPLDVEKKRGAFSLFKAATSLLMPSKVTWKKIVGSILPFHLLQDNKSPPPSAHSIAASPTVDQQAIINRSSSANSDDRMSIYGSTTDLQELDKGSESRYASAVDLQETDDSDDGINSDTRGDEMIDSKAEEFIGKFYLQIDD